MTQLQRGDDSSLPEAGASLFGVGRAECLKRCTANRGLREAAEEQVPHPAREQFSRDHAISMARGFGMTALETADY